MNSYSLDKIAIAQLIEIHEGNMKVGFKNIIGIPIYVNNKCYFYSILDDCFFRGVQYLSNEKLNVHEFYASIYDEHFGINKIKRSFLLKGINKNNITKEEIINGGMDLLSAYFSDLDYEGIKRNTDVDYLDISNLKKYLVINELQYEEVLNRPIIYTNEMLSNQRRL